MLESLLTLSIVGMVAGFIFSVPVAGPISVLITSHALKGEGRYCLRAALGAAIVDFLYCFIAVYGFTHLYLRYEHIIPYILMAGSLLIIYYGIQIMRTRLDLDHLNDNDSVHQRVRRIEQKGGFRAGLALNFLNPSLFIGWLTSSFIVMSLVASLGFNVGNLNNMIGNNVETINQHSLDNGSDALIDLQGGPLHLPAPTEPAPGKTKPFRWSQVINSLTYAFFVCLGTVLWFYYFSRFLISHRQKLDVHILNRLVRILGAVLCLLGVYLIYIASRIFQGLSAGSPPPI